MIRSRKRDHRNVWPKGRPVNANARQRIVSVEAVAPRVCRTKTRPVYANAWIDVVVSVGANSSGVLRETNTDLVYENASHQHRRSLDTSRCPSWPEQSSPGGLLFFFQVVFT